MNLYAYVYNDPLNKTDPTGMIAGVDDAAIIVGAAVIAGAAAIACQPGSACNDAASEAITEAGEAIADAHEALVTKIVDEIVEIEEGIEKGRMEAAEHTKGARPSTKGKHEKGTAAKDRSRGGEKGDARRDPPRKPPPDHKGPWPPPKKPPAGGGTSGGKGAKSEQPSKTCVPDPDGKPKC